MAEVEQAKKEDKENGDEDVTLEFDNVKPRIIWNQHYGGCLVEKIGEKGRTTGQIDWTTYLSSTNKGKVLAYVYYYESIPTADGTYVVLEFVQSEKFFYRRSLLKHPDKLRLKAGGFGPLYPENPEDITTPDDPRVFLMKPTELGGSEVDFITAGHVITLFKDRERPAELVPEGEKSKVPVEGQLFRLLSPEFQTTCSDGHEVVEVVVPPPAKQPEKHHGEL